MGSGVLGEEQGLSENVDVSAYLRRLFWSCMAVVVDIRIGSVDVLFDPIAYLMVASAAADAARVEPLFRRVVALANVSAAFSLATTIRDVRQQPSGGLNGWTLSTSSSSLSITDASAIEVGLIIADQLVDMALVWFLLTACRRLTESRLNDRLAASLGSARRWITVALGFGTLVGLVAAVTGEQPDELVLLAVLVATLAAGLHSLSALWQTTKLEPTLPGSAEPLDSYGVGHDDRPGRTSFRVAIGLAALVAGVAILYELGGRPNPPTADVAFAVANGPKGLVADPGGLAVDISQPRHDPDSDYNGGSFDEMFGDGSDDRSCEIGFLAALDVITGDRLWQHHIPPQPPFNGIATLGDNVLVTDVKIGERLPSMAALNIKTGQPAWQHYIEAPWIWPYGQSSKGVVVTAGPADGQADPEAVMLDSSGAEVSRFDGGVVSRFTFPDQLRAGLELSPTLVTGYFYEDILSGYPHTQSWRYLSSAANYWSSPADGGSQIVLSLDERQLYDVDLATGDVHPMARILARNGFDQFSDGNWPGSPLQATDRHVLVLQGSFDGPDSMAEIYDRADGTVIWRQEGVRSATLVGDHVLYDVRNQADRFDPVTRTLHLVALDDPDSPRWSTDLSVNSFGGNGLIGADNDGLIFVVGTDGDNHEFLVVPFSGESVPDVLRAGGLSGGGPSTMNHVGNGLLVAATETGIIWQRGGRDLQRRSTDELTGSVGVRQNISALAVVDDVLVVQAEPSLYCLGSEREEHLDQLITAPDELRFNRDGTTPSDGAWHDEFGEQCLAPVAKLSAIDPATQSGRLVWSSEVPTATEGLPVVDDDIVVADSGGHQMSPSVALLDAATGRVRWQRFVDAPSLALVGIADGELAVDTDRWLTPPSSSTETTVVQRLDADGRVLYDFASPTHSVNYDGPPPAQLVTGMRSVSHSLAGRDQMASDGRLGEQLINSWDQLIRWNPTTGERQELKPLPFDEEWHMLGNPVSPGPPLQTSDSHSLVLLGSGSGPNSKAVVYDNGTGQVAEIANIRAATLIDDLILYDKRNDKPADGESTRDLYLVSADDPDDVMWSTRLAVNEAGGNGFIGRSPDGDGLTFLVEGATGPRLLTLDKPSAVPEILRAAGTGGAGDPRRGLIDAELTVATNGNQLIWQQPGQPLRAETLPTDAHITALTVVDGLIVIRQQETVEDCW